MSFATPTLLLTLAALSSHAQTLAVADEPDGSFLTSSATVPPAGTAVDPGFNASLASSSQHDSSNGWSSVLSPSLSYRLNEALSADVSIPIYVTIDITQVKGTVAKPIVNTVARHGVVGDTALAAHFDIHRLFDYTATVALALPSGNPRLGLGAGQPTFDLNNHLEKSIGAFAPEFEIGFGDSANLAHPRSRKSYTTIGYNAHTLIGSSIDLPLHLNFSADLYEDLPLTSTTINSTTGRGKKKITTTSSKSIGEDNGVETSLTLPLITMSPSPPSTTAASAITTTSPASPSPSSSGLLPPKTSPLTDLGIFSRKQERRPAKAAFPLTFLIHHFGGSIPFIRRYSTICP